MGLGSWASRIADLAFLAGFVTSDQFGMSFGSRVDIKLLAQFAFISWGH